MYEELRKKLVEDLAMARELAIISYKKPRVRSIFSISSLDDNLYREIIEKFDRISFKYAKKLIGLLCKKYGVEAEFKRDNGYDSQGRSLYSYFLIDRQVVYFKLYPTYELGGVRAGDLRNQAIETGKKVLGVFMVKPNTYNIERLNSMEGSWKKSNPNMDIELITYEGLIERFFGKEEVENFNKFMVDYQKEMHQILGFQITELLNDETLEKLKKESSDLLINFDYKSINDRTSNYDDGSRLEKLNKENFGKLYDNFIREKRYEIMVGESDFARSFLTSEWIFRKYLYNENLDNTYIVAGYLKSVEQLLWDIILRLGQGKYIRGLEIQETDNDDIDKTLGSLEYFITSYENDDIFDEVFAYSKHFLMRYLRGKLRVWRTYYRNGYFHKDNLKDEEKIKKIREETIYIYFLLLGSVDLSKDDIGWLKTDHSF
uniref:hypothetical protein n=1 Tax=Anaerococcus mediterraneensis TaxID=1870984 RepID=UPI0009319F94|nr:hypothetical protein [Anaerococcus mediterraneensis]